MVVGGEGVEGFEGGRLRATLGRHPDRRLLSQIPFKQNRVDLLDKPEKFILKELRALLISLDNTELPSNILFVLFHDLCEQIVQILPQHELVIIFLQPHLHVLNSLLF